MSPSNGSSSSHRRPADRLVKASDYGRWKYLIKNHFRVSPKKHAIYTGKGVIEESNGSLTAIRVSDNHEFSPQTVEEYLVAEVEMNSVVIDCLSPNLGNQLMDIERFVVLWERVEIVVLGERSTRLLELTNRLYKMTWKNSMKNLISHFQSIYSEYQLLGGTLSETEICNMVLRVLPKQYKSFVAVLRRESVLHNNNQLQVKKLIKDLQISVSELDEPKRTENSGNSTSSKRQKLYGNKTWVNQNNAGSKKSGKRKIDYRKYPCSECKGKQGLDHWAKDCLLKRYRQHSAISEGSDQRSDSQESQCVSVIVQETLTNQNSLLCAVSCLYQ